MRAVSYQDRARPGVTGTGSPQEHHSTPTHHPAASIMKLAATNRAPTTANFMIAGTGSARQRGHPTYPVRRFTAPALPRRRLPARRPSRPTCPACPAHSGPPRPAPPTPSASVIKEFVSPREPPQDTNSLITGRGRAGAGAGRSGSGPGRGRASAGGEPARGKALWGSGRGCPGCAGLGRPPSGGCGVRRQRSAAGTGVGWSGASDGCRRLARRRSHAVLTTPASTASTSPAQEMSLSQCSAACPR